MQTRQADVDPKRCIGLVSDRWWVAAKQCSRPRGYGERGEYCRQHAGQDARSTAREQRAQQRRDDDHRIEAEGKVLITRVKAVVPNGSHEIVTHYWSGGPPSTWGYRRSLVVPFEVIEALLRLHQR